LIIVFLIGGGARPDLMALVVLRPLAILVLAFGLLTASGAQLRSHLALIGMGTALVGLHLVQLVPLPRAIWHSLPGRELLIEIDRLAGNAAAWRPMSMTPDATWNSLWSLAVPGAILLLAIQLGPVHHRRLVPLLVALGLVSALIGILQMLGDPQGPLYFYRVTNPGSPVGLFASRTHQAVFLACTLAMAVAWRSMVTLRKSLAALLTLVLVLTLLLLIVATGSRVGAMLGILAATTATFAFRSTAPEPGQAARSNWRPNLTAAAGVIGLLGIAIVLGRALAIERLLATPVSDDLRVRALPTVLAMVRHYAPWGSGFGSFAQVFLVHQPRALIGPAYLNHAHNDWLELLVAAGIPALALMALAAGWLGIRMVRATRMKADADCALPRLGALIMGIFAAASLTDYPLRVPSLMALAVLAAVWLQCAKPSTGRKSSDADATI
jgi:O-antigen ligase